MSLTRDIAPFAQEQLTTKGYAIIKPDFLLQESAEIVEHYVHAFLVACGYFLGSKVGFHFLKGVGSAISLPIHTEGIHLPTGVHPYFSLACFSNAASGGETRLYDARTAAQMLNEFNSDLADVAIDYISGSYDLPPCRRTLVEHHPEWGSVLRFRSGFKSNTYVTYPPGLTPEEIEANVVSIISQAEILRHKWEVGDMLIVNNHITLHDRMPYEGTRIMLRVRYDDHINCKIAL